MTIFDLGFVEKFSLYMIAVLIFLLGMILGSVLYVLE